MPNLTLFLDDGGVISDNSLRRTQWQPLIGDYFTPRLGATPEDWARANIQVMEAVFARDAWQARLERYPDYLTFQRDYLLEWLSSMCRIIGVPVPPDPEAIHLAEQATAWIIPQVIAPQPGSPDAVRHLHSLGDTLYTASGESEADLAGYLGALGIHQLFTTLYGVDIVNTLKSGPRYYRNIFAHAGVDPSTVLVVDDNPHPLAWAGEVGARTILIGPHQPLQTPNFLTTLPSLSHLPTYLSTIST